MVESIQVRQQLADLIRILDQAGGPRVGDGDGGRMSQAASLARRLMGTVDPAHRRGTEPGS